MNISDYLDEVRAKYASGQATEHSYRPALEALFRGVDPTLEVINEPRRVAVGAPDFIFSRGQVPVGWCEAKDIDKDVRSMKGYSVEQKHRYVKAFPNLIYTNGIDFEFIRDAQRVNFVSIADLLPTLPAKSDRFDELARNLRSFAQETPVTIRSAAKLASLMAGKAAIIKDVLGNLLAEDIAFRSSLGGQYKAFKASLLPNLEPAEFADIYAETVTYGMFAARLHDQSLATFSRAEALQLLPRSNPFLRSLFGYIAGPELDDRIAWIIDDLADILRASDPFLLFKDFGKFTARNDPFVHFYEDFLKEYNPKKRKSRGVWYTPEPVVDFIVRAIDDVLKTEFGLADGLADTSKITIDHDTGETHPKSGKPVMVKKEVHRVQILDPATGTGTFLAKAVQLISDRVKVRAPGKWSGYVEQELIPRIHGFELLMASYAMCHMKLDMMLRDTGYEPSEQPPRLSVWLTNALEPGEREVRDLFFTALADEARGASEVKRETPIMCVMGNPPYSGESANKGHHIMQLMEAYKKEPGGEERLKERNPKWINDDYVKFLRMSEDLIAKNPSGGVLGFITNHGYLDNPTFRGMRWHLLKTFDKIWVLDLHGNAQRKDVGPDGTPDKNVFDIQQGVALIIAVRQPLSDGTLAEVRHGDLWGSRRTKGDALWEGNRSSLAQHKLPNRAPQFPFVQRDFAVFEPYEQGVPINSLFTVQGTGIVSKRDRLAFHESRRGAWQSALDILDLSESDFRAKYELPDDVRDWRYPWAKLDIKENKSESKVIDVMYRPFDLRYMYYTGNARGFVGWPVRSLSRHFARRENIGMIYSRQAAVEGQPYNHVLATTQMFDNRGIYSNKGIASIAPLYVYPGDEDVQSDAFRHLQRRPNLDPELYAAMCKAGRIDAADQAAPEDDFRAVTGESRPSEVKVFDYMYGVLHSPAYREAYAEFLKIDFPRIPFPPSHEVFRHVSEKGEQLRRLHLMEAPAIGETSYPYHGDGDDVVASGYPKFEGGKVYINKEQHFAGVPEVAWGFYIGGYQPAQKWLKDRRGRSLSWDDIGHYQKIVKILIETARIMKEVELPLGEPDEA